MSHKTAMMLSDSKAPCLRGGTVNFRQSSEAKQQPILLQQPHYLRAQHILSLVASARSGSYRPHMSEPIAKGSEKSNPSGASFPIHRTELSYFIWHKDNGLSIQASMIPDSHDSGKRVLLDRNVPVLCQRRCTCSHEMIMSTREAPPETFFFFFFKSCLKCIEAISLMSHYATTFVILC